MLPFHCVVEMFEIDVAVTLWQPSVNFETALLRRKLCTKCLKKYSQRCVNVASANILVLLGKPTLCKQCTLTCIDTVNS